MEFKNYLGEPTDVTGHYSLPDKDPFVAGKRTPEWRGVPGRHGDYVADEPTVEVLKTDLDEVDSGTVEFEVRGIRGQAGFAVLQGPRIAVFDVDVELDDADGVTLDQAALIRQFEAAMNSPEILGKFIPFGDMSHPLTESPRDSDSFLEDGDVPFWKSFT